MIFFVDRNISSRVATALGVLHSPKHRVEFHDAHFEIDTPDEVWIRGVASKWPRCNVFSGDRRILTRPQEVEAIRESDLTFFILKGGWGKLEFDDLDWRLIRVFGKAILYEAESLTRPTILEVPLKGRIRNRGPTSHHQAKKRKGKPTRRYTS